MTSPDGGYIHYVSSGSVGKPKDGDPRAGWVEVILGAPADVRTIALEDEAVGPAGRTETWVGAAIHRVEYDVESVAASVVAVGLPERFANALRTA